MRGDDSEDFLRYYWRELTYLRRMGSAFAERYPKVAARLELSTDLSADPHVERLIESFAFLTARIQHNIESDFPEVATELLNLLYPHFLAPVPSMAIAGFALDPKRGKITTGHEVPKHAPVFAQSADGLVCRFRTCYPVVLWPVEVAAARFEPPARYDFLDASADVAAVLRLRLAASAGSLAELALDRMRFHLHGDRMLADALYELLFGHVKRIGLLPEGGKRPVWLPEDALQPVGFGLDEEVLPYPRRSHPAYRLLQEYFAFPEKYLFFDLAHLSAHGSETAFDVLFLLDRPPADRLPVGPGNFVLGATPVVNLFPRTTEPIRLDHRKIEYPLVPDSRREKTTEIHTILSVSASSDPRDRTRVFAPFYSWSHQMEDRGQRAFWHARRLPSARKDVPGTEMVLSLLDLDFKPALPAVETIFAHTLCTNRALAGELPAGAELQTDLALPVARISSLAKPTLQVLPPLGGSHLWRLVSQLSLNHLTLAGGEEGLLALREILRLYGAPDGSSEQQILGLRELSHRPVVRRVGDEAWRGFCRGSEVTLVFDEEAYVGSSAFLLAAVLDRFFALYASVNSFTELVVRSHQREGIWKRWPARVGEQIVL